MMCIFSCAYNVWLDLRACIRKRVGKSPKGKELLA